MNVAAMGLKDTEENKRKTGEIADECMNVTHPDVCERAILYGKCMEKSAKEKNLELAS